MRSSLAGIAQLGERQTEDLKVPGSIPGHGRFLLFVRFCLNGMLALLCFQSVVPACCRR